MFFSPRAYTPSDAAQKGRGNEKGKTGKTNRSVDQKRSDRFCGQPYCDGSGMCDCNGAHPYGKASGKRDPILRMGDLRRERTCGVRACPGSGAACGVAGMYELRGPAAVRYDHNTNSISFSRRRRVAFCGRHPRRRAVRVPAESKPPQTTQISALCNLLVFIKNGQNREFNPRRKNRNMWLIRQRCLHHMLRFSVQVKCFCCAVDITQFT